MDAINAEETKATRNPWRRLVLPLLKHIPAKRLSEETGLVMSTVKAARHAHTLPRERS